MASSMLKLCKDPLLQASLKTNGKLSGEVDCIPQFRQHFNDSSTTKGMKAEKMVRNFTRKKSTIITTATATATAIAIAIATTKEKNTKKIRKTVLEYHVNLMRKRLLICELTAATIAYSDNDSLLQVLEFHPPIGKLRGPIL
ncbi:hypothetical protein GQX74_008788 [Glossina fuscipes]|nr:hypothetical protein GQX74_008788 [Glossina fuscipes]